MSGKALGKTLSGQLLDLRATLWKLHDRPCEQGFHIVTTRYQLWKKPTQFSFAISCHCTCKDRDLEWTSAKRISPLLSQQTKGSIFSALSKGDSLQCNLHFIISPPHRVDVTCSRFLKGFFSAKRGFLRSPPFGYRWKIWRKSHRYKLILSHYTN